MTSVFSADGKMYHALLSEVGPCVVTQVKTVEKMAMQLFSWVSRTKGKTYN